jgi:ABC-type lipoprotein release transport system permease subunit
MNIWKIIKCELNHKKVSFIMGVLSLMTATTGFVATFILLKSDEIVTEQKFMEKEKELREEMIQLEDDYRIIMRNMGYNVLILNKEQSIPELEKNGYATTYLDYEDAWIVAESGIKTLNHLMPVLQEKIWCEEKNREILLAGIRGQVPVYSKPPHLTDDFEYRSPIMERVPDGKADLGEEVAVSLNLRPGDKIVISGVEFEVNRVYSRRGTRDDLTVWVPLDDAQKILGKPGKINGILALECVCAVDELGQLKNEIRKILPHAQVFEFSSLIAARADVRKRASDLHEEILTAEVMHQSKLRQEKEKLASLLVALLIAGASVWIFVSILNNVRERKHETGILRAIGFSRYQVLQIFLGKSAIMGIIAGVAGCLLGVFIGIFFSGTEGTAIADLVSLPVVLPGLLLAPVLALTAGLIPSVMAAGQDPAVILSEE